MSETKRASHDEVSNAESCKRQRHNKPTRVSSLTTVDISRLLGAIPGEFGALLGQKILEKRIDGNQLVDWLSSVEVKAEEPVVTDIFCKHSDLLLPFLEDRASWIQLRSLNSQIYNCNRSITPPWPQKILRVGSPVNSVTFSSDGGSLACGSDDGIVRLWNGRNGSCTLLEGHTESVRCVSFSKDGKLLASGGLDKSIRLWKLDDQSHRVLEVRKLICLSNFDDQSHRVLEGRTGAIRNGAITLIAFSPSGSSLASGSLGSGDIRLWDISSGSCIRTLSTKLENLWSVVFSPDGVTLAIGGSSSSIFLWDVEANDDSGSPSSIIETDEQSVSFLAYSPNGMFLASVWNDTVNIWRASDRSLEKSLGGPHFATALLSSNGKVVASSWDRGTVRLWTMNDLEDLKCLGVSPYVHRDNSLAISPYYAHRDNTVRRFNGEEESRALVPISVAFTANGRTLASGGEYGYIFLWDIPFLQ